MRSTRDLAQLGYAFAEVRPHGERNNTTHEISLAFTVDDAPKVYIERLDIVGNTRTRDYVIRREFDIGEGDPYNHAMIERAERRLNNLGFFKSVHISTRPGSAPDRVIVTVQVEDKPTGSVSVSGGYSTTEGILAEVAFTETNFLGRGQYVKISASAGQYSNGWNLTFTEPYFLDQHLAAGFDIFHKEQNVNPYAEYQTWTTGVNLRLGVPITDEFTFQPNYSIYESQIIIPNTPSQPYDDCGPPNNGPLGTTIWNQPGVGYQLATPYVNCLTNGEASIAMKEEAAQGVIVTSLVGYSLIWDNVDNRKDPTTGTFVTFHQDFAGLGGQSDFIRETYRRSLLLSDHRRHHRLDPLAGRPDHRLWQPVSADRRQLQPGSDAGARLRARRHRSARYFGPEQHCDQRTGRHDLFRRVGGSSVPDLRLAEGIGPEGRPVRGRRHFVRLLRQDQLLQSGGLHLLPAAGDHSDHPA